MYQQPQPFSAGFPASLPFNPYAGEQHLPKVDVVETPGEIIYIMEVPGADLNSVDVQIVNGSLKVEARAETGLQAQELNYLYRERPFTKRYARVLIIPLEADQEKAFANVKNGLLTVHFPKKNVGRRVQLNQQQQGQNYFSPQQQQFNPPGH